MIKRALAALLVGLVSPLSDAMARCLWVWFRFAAESKADGMPMQGELPSYWVSQLEPAMDRLNISRYRSPLYFLQSR